MAKKRKILSVLLTLCILLTVFTAAGVTSYAKESEAAETGAEGTSGFYKYTTSGDTAIITEYTGSAINLTLPVSLDGYTITGIGDHAFDGCGTLVNVTIPNTVSAALTSIGNYAFSGCSNMQSISIPPSVTSIGEHAFYCCSSLTKITLPNSVVTIGQRAFCACRALESITLSNSLKSIGEFAFGGNDSLYSITVPASVSFIDNYAFGYNTWYGNNFSLGDRDPNFVVKGYTGSDAERYALENDFNFVSLGSIPVYVDPEAPLFYVSDSLGVTGHEFTVDVGIDNNPGITSLSLELDYPDIFTLTSVEYKQLFSSKATGSGDFESPFVISWFSTSSKNEKNNGVIATLTFKVKDDAELGEKAIALSYDPENVFDISFKSVDFGAKSAVIKVKDHYPGDMNKDAKINMKDIVLLQQYINKWKVDLTADVADINGDSKVNMKDVVLLQQFVNGWEVELE